MQIVLFFWILFVMILFFSRIYHMFFRNHVFGLQYFTIWLPSMKIKISISARSQLLATLKQLFIFLIRLFINHISIDITKARSRVSSYVSWILNTANKIVYYYLSIQVMPWIRIYYSKYLNGTETINKQNQILRQCYLFEHL